MAGHAGLFSTAADVAALGQIFLDGGHPLLHAETVAEMTRLQAEQDTIRRGLGFVLWSPDSEGTVQRARRWNKYGDIGTARWAPFMFKHPMQR